ncbi:MAG: hypothetical protein ABIR19_00725, partial [Ginsengibacter sp.]
LNIKRASLMSPFFKSNTLSNFFIAMFTFFLVNVTWVFFRAANFPAAKRMLTSMFGRANYGIALLPTRDILIITVVITLMVLIHWFMRDTTVLQVAKKIKWWVVATIWAMMLIAIIVSQKSGDSFIYFQF